MLPLVYALQIYELCVCVYSMFPVSGVCVCLVPSSCLMSSFFFSPLTWLVSQQYRGVGSRGQIRKEWECWTLFPFFFFFFLIATCLKTPPLLLLWPVLLTSYHTSVCVSSSPYATPPSTPHPPPPPPHGSLMVWFLWSYFWSVQVLFFHLCPSQCHHSTQQAGVVAAQVHRMFTALISVEDGLMVPHCERVHGTLLQKVK